MQCLAAIPHSAYALLAAVVLGMPVTYGWAQTSHYFLRRRFPTELADDKRVIWLAIVTGMLNRTLLTTLAIWMPQAAGPVLAAIIAVQAVLGWGRFDKDAVAGRARYNVSMLNVIFSLTWAVAWGIWGGWELNHR